MSAHAGDAGPPSPLRLTCVVLEGYAYLALILAIFLVTPAFLLWGVLTQRPFIAITALLIGAPASATAARALPVPRQRA